MTDHVAKIAESCEQLAVLQATFERERGLAARRLVELLLLAKSMGCQGPALITLVGHAIRAGRAHNSWLDRQEDEALAREMQRIQEPNVRTLIEHGRPDNERN